MGVVIIRSMLWLFTIPLYSFFTFTFFFFLERNIEKYIKEDDREDKGKTRIYRSLVIWLSVAGGAVVCLHRECPAKVPQGLLQGFWG